MSYVQPRQYSLLLGPGVQGVPDGILVGQAQAGDQHAFELLVNRYRRPLLSYMRTFLRDDEQASDVLQQVYLQLYLSLPLLLTNRSLKGWLLRVARNRCLDELRLRRRRAEIPFSTLACDAGEEDLSPLEVIPDPGPLPEEVVERIDLHGTLQKALASLPSKFRSIIHLRYFGQLSFEEIGRVLNMPEATVKTYFYRALPRLRRALTGNTRFAAVS